MNTLRYSPKPLKANKTQKEKRFLKKAQLNKYIKKLQKKKTNYKKRTINVKTGTNRKYKIYQVVTKKKK